MLFYILKGKRCRAYSIITQEWGKRWRELEGYKVGEEDEEGGKKDECKLSLEEEKKKKTPQLPEELRSMVIPYLGYASQYFR